MFYVTNHYRIQVNTFLRANIVVCTTDGCRYPRVAKSRFAEDYFISNHLKICKRTIVSQRDVKGSAEKLPVASFRNQNQHRVLKHCVFGPQGHALPFLPLEKPGGSGRFQGGSNVLGIIELGRGGSRRGSRWVTFHTFPSESK